MADQSTTYSQSCSMNLVQAAQVSQMIASRAEFWGVTTNIYEDSETFPPELAQEIPEGKCLVTFEIPREGIDMPNFYGAFYKALQPPESTATVKRERGS